MRASINFSWKVFGQCIVPTINVPIVYMARYVMVLRRARLREALEGVGGPGNQDFLGTAKTQCRIFETNIHRKGIAWPQSQFSHSCVREWFIYSHDGSAYSAAGKYVDQSWEYINRSQINECGNWD